MDNLTHTLVSVMVGESLARAAPSSPEGLPARERRELIVATMAIGGNLPDLDFLNSFVTGSKLDYLLHHRGHTHTLVGALAIAALLHAAQLAWIRWRGHGWTASDRRRLLAAALLAGLLHVAMDFTNSYGVHPFWPLDNRWFYGDSVFIIEPLLWAACAPLVFVLRTIAGRAIVAFVVAAGAALAIASGLVPIGATAAYIVAAGVLLFIGWRAPPSVALASGVTFWLAVTVMFAATGRLANARADALAARQFPNEALLDSILTPMPVNPLCWEVILVQSTEDQVVLRRGMLSLQPAWFGADRCIGRGLAASATAPVMRFSGSIDPEVRWYGQYASSRARIAEIIRRDCRARAFMQFVRAPWLATVDGALAIGDLRFDREPALGFAEIDLSENPGACPSRTPPWTRPRADLFP